ncbi:MAG: AAA domain-containing protein, partial [Acidobacteriota bacterium]
AIDYGNLARHCLASTDTEIEKVECSGITVSSGCLMTIAQQASSYKKYDERGLFLSEHRRCVGKIVNYCNELAYAGKLIPLRDESNLKNFPLPHIGYAHIPGRSQPYHGSKRNIDEAYVIAQWIADNHNWLLDYYKSIEPDEKKRKELAIENIIAVVTPFNAQTKEIKRALNKLAVPPLTVGTVHALQGAERNIVIFSPVYDRTQNKTKYFFDDDKHMLNVAVSRAKDSFLVFGDMDIFDIEATHLPSGLLATYLFSAEENEIANVRIVERPISPDKVQIKHINTLKGHQQELINCFKLANNNIWITSPYLRSNAINADKIDQLVLGATARNVVVTIYTDPRQNQGDGSEDSFIKGIDLLKNCGATIKKVANIHNKTICVDDRVLIEGSFNWLSAARSTDSMYYRYESSLRYEGPQVDSMINKTVKEMECRVSEPEIVSA